MGRILVPRRKLLQGLGAGAGLAACGAPPSSDRAPTQAERGSIDTIVMLMMENRSFDHYFGSYSLSEGRSDVDGLVAGMVNEDRSGNPIEISRMIDPCVTPDPPHGWSSSRTQFDDGSNLGFVNAYQDSYGPAAPLSYPMTYLTRDQLPVYYALADEYALCQRWFSSVLTSTWPNRLYFHAAQSQGITNNDLPPEGHYTCRTIWDQLTDAGVEWGYYFSDLPTLALFGRPEWAGRLKSIQSFYADAAAGALPPVVCVDAGASYNDDHPPHHPLLGQMFVASIYEALATSPHWDRCQFFLTYDEAGGFFDHVPPPTMPDDFVAEGFNQMGFRVPSLAMGPYVKNIVSDVQFDHTAPLRFIQEHFGIDERLTRRDEASEDLGALLDVDLLAAGQPRPPIVLPPITLTEEEVEAECEAASRRPTGQPELQRYVAETQPSLDRSGEAGSVARAFWQRLGDQGLWVPGG